MCELLSEHKPLASGIPTIGEYKKLVAQKSFQKIAGFASSFLNDHYTALEPYRLKWVEDPFRQWSRQYEYPYVFNEIEEYTTRNQGPLSILDAGSGITFFSYYLTSEFDVKVKCVDYDKSLEPMFQSISGKTGASVTFESMGINELNYPSDSFDIIYCISVLEHTENYPEIIKEFKRVLKPGGKLIVTFDISVNGEYDIPVEQAEILLDEIENSFGTIEKKNALNELNWTKLVTTQYTYQTDRSLLPFKTRHPLDLRTLIKHLIPGKNPYFFPYLSFYCLSVAND